jgi:colicin import membrane protein
MILKHEEIAAQEAQRAKQRLEEEKLRIAAEAERARIEKEEKERQEKLKKEKAEKLKLEAARQQQLQAEKDAKVV